MHTTVAAISSPSQKERYQVIFAGVCALILTVGLARFAYTPMLPIMRSQAGLSYLAGGWLATINYAGYISGALLAASISDLGRKFVLYRIGLVIALLSTAAMGMTEDFYLWALLRFVSGLSSTAGLLLASGLVLNWLMRQGCRPELGLHFTGVGLGIAVSGLAVAGMVEWLRWDQQWIGLGVLGIAFFLPAWGWLPAHRSLFLRGVRIRHQRYLHRGHSRKATPPRGEGRLGLGYRRHRSYAVVLRLGPYRSGYRPDSSPAARVWTANDFHHPARSNE